MILRSVATCAGLALCLSAAACSKGKASRSGTNGMAGSNGAGAGSPGGASTGGRTTGAGGSRGGSEAAGAPATSGGAGTGGAGTGGSGGGTPTGGTGPSTGGRSNTGGFIPVGGARPTTPFHLHISEERFSEIEAAVADNTPEWELLKSTVDSYMDDSNPGRNHASNSALVYLFTGDPAYAQAAYQKCEQTIYEHWDFEEGHENGGYYYDVGDYIRPTAMTLDYCEPDLTQEQIDFLLEFTDNILNEIWFDMHYTVGWGQDDPGNNFHHAYLEATAHGAYILEKFGHPNAQTYFDVLEEKLPYALEFLNEELPSGDFWEGVNYGQRSRQRFSSALSAVASTQGTNHFADNPFFEGVMQYVTYQSQPGKHILYVAGDMTRVGREHISPADRDYLQTMVYYMGDSEARRRGQYYLDHWAPSYMGSDYDSYDRWDLLWKDVVFKLDLPEIAPEDLPLSFVTGGTQWALVRSSWEDDATSLVISGAPSCEISHQHLDTGSFQLWKRDWQVVDVESLEADGSMPEGHSMIVVDQSTHQWMDDTGGGLVQFEDADSYVYAQVNGTLTALDRPDSQTYNYLLDEWTREFVYLRPDFLVVYDRVDGTDGVTYHNQFHLSSEPGADGESWTNAFGGGSMTLLPLAGGAVSTANSGGVWRVEQAQTGEISRFLNVLLVADGETPPELSARHIESDDGSLEGMVWEDQVVLFSSNPLGEQPNLPVSYTVPGSGSFVHTLVNVSDSVDLSIDDSSGDTVVTLTSGNAYTPTDAGVVRIEP